MLTPKMVSLKVNNIFFAGTRWNCPYFVWLYWYAEKHDIWIGYCKWTIPAFFSSWFMSIMIPLNKSPMFSGSCSLISFDICISSSFQSVFFDTFLTSWDPICSVRMNIKRKSPVGNRRTPSFWGRWNPKCGESRPKQIIFAIRISYRMI